MGILNLTPDSFYDGGVYSKAEQVRARVLQMVNDGVDIIDVGGESSRPGAEEVNVREELERLSHVFDLVRELEIPFSVDTYKPETARIALKNGFTLLNDITGGGENGEMFELAAEYNVSIIIMHMAGTPRTMQQNPHYDDIIETLLTYFNERVALAKTKGLKDDQIILDPGIGFGKRVRDNDDILLRLQELVGLGYPLLIGASRKSFLSVAGDQPAERLATSIAALTIAVSKGANIIRVHDVKESVKCVKFMHRLLNN